MPWSIRHELYAEKTANSDKAPHNPRPRNFGMHKATERAISNGGTLIAIHGTSHEGKICALYKTCSNWLSEVSFAIPAMASTAASSKLNHTLTALRASVWLFLASTTKRNIQRELFGRKKIRLFVFFSAI